MQVSPVFVKLLHCIHHLIQNTSRALRLVLLVDAVITAPVAQKVKREEPAAVDAAQLLIEEPAVDAVLSLAEADDDDVVYGGFGKCI